MGYQFEELELGMESSFSKVITEQDIMAFANVSGDTNPLHLDEAFAKDTRFKTRIAHGMLTASLISAVIGTALPGDTSIYVSQNLKFKAPVMIGDLVTAIATITGLDPERNIVTLRTICKTAKATVIEGEARIMVPGLS